LFCIIPIFGDELITYKKALFRSIQFVDDNHGWLAGCRGLFYTSDGGENWQRKPINTCLPERFFMGTNQIGWADSNQILFKSDEGLVTGNLTSGKWEVRKASQLFLQELKTIFFIDRERGWGLMNKSICYTNDSGATWKQIPYPTRRYLFDLFAISASELWAVGSDMTILHSIDGGQSWDQRSLAQEGSRPGTSADFDFITFVNSQEGWIGGTGIIIFHTTDGGKSWQKQITPHRGGNLNGGSFHNEKEGWVVGTQVVNKKPRGIILYTNDGGLHWEIQGDEISDNLVDVQALSNGWAWVLGSNGTVLRTTNHGKTWTVVKID
jgi:photosystem II stability/assembly factor-like uncharacterized protein